MLKPDQTLDLSPMGARFTIRKTARETGGSSFDMEWELEPNTPGAPVHIHPEAIETYTILEGEMEVYLKDKWITARQGDKVVVEKGVPHTYRNSSDKPVKLYNTHEPAMQFEEFFEGLGRVCDSGVIRNKKMGLDAVISLSMLWTSFPREIKSVKPPHFVMELMSWIGRLKGVKF